MAVVEKTNKYIDELNASAGLSIKHGDDVLDCLNNILDGQGLLEDKRHDDLDAAVYAVLKNSGGGESSSGDKAVKFIDYDGTVLYSYTTQEALALTQLPANPEHSGLVSQGWNYTLEQLQAECNNSGACTVGQMYITDDGKTRVMVQEPSNGEYAKIRVASAPGTIVYVDWGDGTIDTVPGADVDVYWTELEHLYSSGSSLIYTISIYSEDDAEYGFSFYDISSGDYYAEYVLSAFIGQNAQLVAYAFNDSYYLKYITIPSSVTSIGEYAFYYCSALTSVTIPSSVTSIGEDAFSYCTALTSVTIPEGVTSIGEYAFYYCSALTSVNISDGVASIGVGAFYYCPALTSVIISEGVASIDAGAFSSCTALTSVTIPSSVTSIGDEAFSSCSALTSVTIPEGVMSIGDEAFSDCYALDSITIEKPFPPVIGEHPFDYVYPTYTIYVPYGCRDAYVNYGPWSEYADNTVEMDPPGPEKVYVTSTEDGWLDKTVNEIKTALDAGALVDIQCPELGWHNWAVNVEYRYSSGFSHDYWFVDGLAGGSWYAPDLDSYPQLYEP